MGKKKTNTTNTVSWSPPPTTQAVTDLQGMVNNGDYQVPIRNSYARSEQDLSNSYSSPLGAYTTADVRDKALRSQKQSLHQNMGIDLANAAQQNADARFNRQSTIAGLTAPQMYTSGSRSTVSDPMGTIMGIGSIVGGLGQAAMT